MVSSTVSYVGYTLWLFNIAMENGPFIDGLPIKNADFPWLCGIYPLVNKLVDPENSLVLMFSLIFQPDF